MKQFLSKTDYRLARTCPAKLYYRKQGYASTADDNDYLQLLSDGGYMIESIARLLYPDGLDIALTGAYDDAFAATQAQLATPNVTLFGALLISGTLLARADILVKRGNQFDLIEVKSKAFDGGDPDFKFVGKRGAIKSEWLDYLEDVAFQTHVLQSVYPQARIRSWLLMPDKSKPVPEALTFGQFEIDNQNTHSFNRPKLTFRGKVGALRAGHFLSQIDVTDEVHMLLPDVAQCAAEFAESLRPTVIKIAAPLGTACRDCEFRLGGEGHDGFKECWGELARPEPHLLDMFQITRPGNVQKYAEALIHGGRTSLFDLEESKLTNANGEVGATDQRRVIQLKCSRLGSEWIDDRLRVELTSHAYPLHFIDFETSRPAVPYHAGMKPYEIVAFQWSCHTLRYPGGEVEHAEWINTADTFPNFAFAESLADWLGGNGTVYIWSQHEIAVLNDIRQQMHTRQYHQPSLDHWLRQVSVRGDGARFVDMLELAKTSYYHPLMRGRLSIKQVLPATWQMTPRLHTHPYFSRYYQPNGNSLHNPYDTLPPLPFGNGREEVVQEGTAAMRAYQEMLYGTGRRDADQREKWQQLLLQYCELDTAAMVIIWWRWASYFNLVA